MRFFATLALALAPVALAAELPGSYSETRELAESLFPLDPAARELYTYNATRCKVLQPNKKKSYDEDADAPEVESLSQGRKAAEFLSELRGGDGGFYREVLDNIMWYMCEQKDKADVARCVPEADAAKDLSGNNCIVTANFFCPAGQCEAKDNCLWKKAVTGEVRDRWYTEKEGAGAEDYLMGTTADSYAAKTGKYLAGAMVLAALNIVFWFIFILGRCCCCCLHSKYICRCCSWKPKEDGYNVCYQVRTPIFFYIFFLACIVGASFAAFLGDQDIGKSMNDLFDHARDGLGDMQGFLGDASAPMVAISGLVNQASTYASSTLTNNDYVRTDMDAVVKSLEDWGVVYAGALDLASAKNDFEAATSGLSHNVDPIVKGIESTLETLDSALVEQKDALQDAIDEAIDQVKDLNETVDGFYMEIDSLDDKVEENKAIRMGAILAVFGLSIFCIFFGFLGVISYWTPCKWDDILIYLMNVTWFLGSIIVTFAWILAGITAFIAVFFNDSCNFLDIVVEDFEPYVGSAASVGLNACFNNTPLVIAFNLTKRVAFQKQIDDQLGAINNFNVAEDIRTVSEPLDLIKKKLRYLTTNVTEPFSDFMNVFDSTNDAYSTTIGQGSDSIKTLCPFDMDFMTIDNLKEMMDAPWTLARDKYTGTGSTLISASDAAVTASWVDINGAAIELNPTPPDANAGAWYDRVTSVQGICTGANCGGADANTACTTGTDCTFACKEIISTFRTLYAQTIPNAYNNQTKMLIDLGGEYDAGNCPDALTWPPRVANGAYDCTQPTAEFLALGNTNTISAGLDSYATKLTATFNDIIAIAESAVGDIMNEVEKFLCNMKCGFVADVYANVHGDICENLLGGILQISAGFWFLALFMFLTSFLGSILVVRMRGVSKEEAEDYEEGVEMKAVNLDLYN